MLSCLRRNTGLLLATLSLGLSSLLLASVPSDWKTLAPGMNLKYFAAKHPSSVGRSEEHTSELQSQSNLVCRLLLEKKKKPTVRRRDLRTQATTHRAPRQRPRYSTRG